MKFLSSEKLSAHKYKTPEGYLICTDAILARTGKQTYRKSEVFADSDDDSEIEVDRKAEEVFAPETLASFENKPITVEHPDENVGPDNYNTLSVGFVRDVRRGEADGQEVMLGTLVITDAQTIEEIENGEHTDLSCGYDCDIADEANPQQRNIRGNHVALCEQGRAGIARIVDSVKDYDAKAVKSVQAKIDELKATISRLEGNWGETAESRSLKKKLAEYYENLEIAKRQSAEDSVKTNDAIAFLETYQGSDIWQDEHTKELYIAISKSGKKLGKLNTNDLDKAKKIINERNSFLDDAKCKDSILGKRVIIRPRDVRMNKYVDEKGVVYSYEGTDADDTVEVKLNNGQYVEVRYDEIRFLDSVKDSKFVIYNDDNDSFGRFATKEEAKAAIKELKNQDKKYGNPFEEHYRIELEDAETVQEELAQQEYNKLKAERKAVENEIDRNDNNDRYDFSRAHKELDEIDAKIKKLKSSFGYAIEDNSCKDDLYGLIKEPEFRYYIITALEKSEKWGDEEYNIYVKAKNESEAKEKFKRESKDEILRIREGNHSEYLKFTSHGMTIDSKCKDDSIIQKDGDWLIKKETSRFGHEYIRVYYKGREMQEFDLDDYDNENEAENDARFWVHAEKRMRGLNDSKCNDAYYLVGGYNSPSDYMLKQDKQHAQARGLKTSVEEIDGSWQLIIEGPKDKVRDIVENYFAGDVSSIGDSVKDAIIIINYYDKNHQEHSWKTWARDKYEALQQFEITHHKNGISKDDIISIEDSKCKDENYYTVKKDGLIYLRKENGELIGPFYTLKEASEHVGIKYNDSVKDEFKPGDFVKERTDYGEYIKVKVIRKVSKNEIPGYLNANAGNYYEVESDSKHLGKSRSIVFEGRLTKDSVKDEQYNRFEKETDKHFLKEAINEMRRYVSNWAFMTPRDKQMIAPMGLSWLKQELAFAEHRLQALDSCKDSKYTIRYVDNDTTYIKHVKGHSLISVLKHIKK